MGDGSSCSEATPAPPKLGLLIGYEDDDDDLSVPNAPQPEESSGILSTSKGQSAPQGDRDPPVVEDDEELPGPMPLRQPVDDDALRNGGGDMGGSEEEGSEEKRSDEDKWDLERNDRETRENGDSMLSFATSGSSHLLRRRRSASVLGQAEGQAAMKRPRLMRPEDDTEKEESRTATESGSPFSNGSSDVNTVASSEVDASDSSTYAARLSLLANFTNEYIEFAYFETFRNGGNVAAAGAGGIGGEDVETPKKPPPWSAELDHILRDLSRSGVVKYPWLLLKVPWACKLEQVYTNRLDNPLLDLSVASEGLLSSTVRAISHRIRKFEKAPFSIRRATEVLLYGDRMYRRVSKWLYALKRCIVGIRHAAEECIPPGVEIPLISVDKLNAVLREPNEAVTPSAPSLDRVESIGVLSSRRPGGFKPSIGNSVLFGYEVLQQLQQEAHKAQTARQAPQLTLEQRRQTDADGGKSRGGSLTEEFLDDALDDSDDAFRNPEF